MKTESTLNLSNLFAHLVFIFTGLNKIKPRKTRGKIERGPRPYSTPGAPTSRTRWEALIGGGGSVGRV